MTDRRDSQLPVFRKIHRAIRLALLALCGTTVLPTPILEAVPCGAMAFNPITGKLDCVGQADTPVFSVATFSDALASTIEIGAAGVWKTSGSISFTATYTNGPATSGTVSGGGFSGLVMTNTFQGPTASPAAVSFPSVGGTVVFTLTASNGGGSATKTITHSFNNDRYWGVSTNSGTYAASDVTGLGNSDLVNSIGKTFTVTAGSGQYIVYSYPNRLGTASFTVNGFTGGFLSPQTVSITNGSSYTENYSVYRSLHSNLGSTTVVVTTP